MKSGVCDINGVNVCSGDMVKLTIKQQHAEPLVFMKKIIFKDAAFRFDGAGRYDESCIGDIGHNCTLEVVNGD